MRSSGFWLAINLDGAHFLIDHCVLLINPRGFSLTLHRLRDFFLAKFGMAAVHRFILSKAGKACQVDTSTHSARCSFVIGESRSIIRISVSLTSSSDVTLDKIVVDDSFNLIEYPIDITLSGVGSGGTGAPKKLKLHERSGIDAGVRFSAFETYLVVLDGCKYQLPIRGWIHYRTV